MKIRLYFFSTIIFYIFILSACKKENKANVTSKHPISCPSYYYKDFSPDTSISVMIDTLNYDLDIDNDLIPDMSFRLSSGWDVISHQISYEYTISVSGSSQIKFIRDYNYCNGPCSPPLDSLSYIRVDDIANPTFSIEYQDLSASISCNCFNQIRYLGYQLTKNGNKYLGWIRLKADHSTLTIYEFATNLCVVDSMMVGQH